MIVQAFSFIIRIVYKMTMHDIGIRTSLTEDSAALRNSRWLYCNVTHFIKFKTVLSSMVWYVHVLLWNWERS